MRRTAIALAAFGLMTGGAVFGAGATAATTACSAQITVTHPSGSRLVLTPATAKVAVGDCVQFVNSTQAKLTVKIAGTPTYDATVAAGTTTPRESSYFPSAAGTDTVTASETVLLAVKLTGTGHVKVSASASKSPAPSSSPKAGHSPSPGKSPDVASKPKHHKSHKGHHHGARPRPTGIKLPPLPPLPTVGATAAPKGTNPLVAPGPNSAAPTTTESSSPVAVVVSGPIESVTDNSRGLPEAVAVLVALGALSGWGRVLLAHSATSGSPRPVERRRRGRHRT